MSYYNGKNYSETADKLVIGGELAISGGRVTQDGEEVTLGGTPYVLPEATTSELGGVKQSTYVADPAGDTVTKAEFIALRDALVDAGLMAPQA